MTRKTVALADFLRGRHLSLEVVVSATGVSAALLAHDDAHHELVRAAALLIGKTPEQLTALVLGAATPTPEPLAVVVDASTAHVLPPEVSVILPSPDESRTIAVEPLVTFEPVTFPAIEVPPIDPDEWPTPPTSYPLAHAASDEPEIIVQIDPDETKDEEPVAAPVRTSGKPADIDDTARETPKAKRSRSRKPRAK